MESKDLSAETHGQIQVRLNTFITNDLHILLSCAIVEAKSGVICCFYHPRVYAVSVAVAL